MKLKFAPLALAWFLFAANGLAQASQPTSLPDASGINEAAASAPVEHKVPIDEKAAVDEKTTADESVKDLEASPVVDPKPSQSLTKQRLNAALWGAASGLAGGAIFIGSSWFILENSGGSSGLPPLGLLFLPLGPLLSGLTVFAGTAFGVASDFSVGQSLVIGGGTVMIRYLGVAGGIALGLASSLILIQNPDIATLGLAGGYMVGSVAGGAIGAWTMALAVQGASRLDQE